MSAPTGSAPRESPAGLAERIGGLGSIVASRAAFLLGTLAQRLVAQATGDVLVLPHDAAAAKRGRGREEARRSGAVAPRQRTEPAS